MRPVSYPLHQSVLHRIEVDIIDVPLEVLLIAQCVLPVASLPNAALAFGDPAGRNLFAGGESTREGRFDQAPAHGKIGVAVGQGLDRVEVVR